MAINNENVMDFMAKDHDRLDNIFNKFRESINENTKKLIPIFHEFKVGLQRHIVWEEEILFPLFEEKTGMSDSGPTEVMRMEHRQIKGILEEIHNGLAQGNKKGLKQLSQNLLDVLSSHNNKEENILYPEIDSLINEIELKGIFNKMDDLPAEKYNKCCS